MKKEVRKRTRSKWFLGVGIGLACVALASTGFAVWIVSASVTSVDTDATQVSVDTAQNESVQFAASIVDETEGSNAGKLNITENYTKEYDSDAYVTNSSEDADFSVSLSTLSITAGEQYLATNTIDYIEVSISAWAWQTDHVDTAAIDSISHDDDLIGSRTWTETSTDSGIYSESYTYVELETTSITVSNSADWTDNLDGTKTWSQSENTTISFKWGSFFGNSSPCTYYNAWLDADSSRVNNSNLAGITNEINEMHDRLEGSSITLTLAIHTA